MVVMASERGVSMVVMALWEGCEYGGDDVMELVTVECFTSRVIDSQSFLCTCPLLQIRSELMAMFSRLAVETALSDIYCNKGTDMSSLFTLRMEDAKFLQCIGTPTVYAPAMSCPWCNGVNSLVWCKMNITCVGEAAFCESTYLFNNAGNFISSHCQKRTVCLDEERNNRKSCIFNGTTQIRCTYCSYGEVDEPIIDGGLFTEHHFFLSFIKERAHSEEYSDNDRIASSIRRTLHNFYGGIVVRVQDYFPVAVDDKVRVSAIIYVTVLNIQNVKELKEKIAKDFLDKVHEDAGYFKDQNVDPSSIFLADSGIS
ncbi:uncharacterized protein LOC131942555 [Physella acuta]|uniref:uncharacterized protein LOC131942555 n=1 Tax=Physella acuta TaxID=109671 RepID=UPI0027DC0E9E|nr:uncharacterized protein LOC131942555 [Physella acuta]